MHRQSLGSSASKPQGNHGGKEEKSNDEPQKETLGKEEEEKGEKLFRSSCRTERLVHLIPILLFVCMFVLYFFSHDPTQKDLVKIADSGRFFYPRDSVNLGRSFGDEKIEGVLTAAAIYSHRSLQQIRKNDGKLPFNNIHRKIGAF